MGLWEPEISLADKQRVQMAVLLLIGLFLVLIGISVGALWLALFGLLCVLPGAGTMYLAFRQGRAKKRVATEEAEIRAYQLRVARGEEATVSGPPLRVEVHGQSGQQPGQSAPHVAPAAQYLASGPQPGVPGQPGRPVPPGRSSGYAQPGNPGHSGSAAPAGSIDTGNPVSAPPPAIARNNQQQSAAGLLPPAAGEQKRAAASPGMTMEQQIRAAALQAAAALTDGGSRSRPEHTLELAARFEVYIRDGVPPQIFTQKMATRPVATRRGS